MFSGSVTVKLAAFFTKAAEPTEFPSMLKLTLPARVAGEGGVNVAVRLKLCPATDGSGTACRKPETAGVGPSLSSTVTELASTL